MPCPPNFESQGPRSYENEILRVVAASSYNWVELPVGLAVRNRESSNAGTPEDAVTALRPPAAPYSPLL